MCRNWDHQLHFDPVHCNLTRQLNQGDAIVLDIKGRKYLGHVQRFIAPGIFQLTEKSLKSVRPNEALQLFELNLESSEESSPSHTANAYLAIDSENGTIDW